MPDEKDAKFEQAMRDAQVGETASRVTKENVGNEPGGAPHQGNVRA